MNAVAFPARYERRDLLGTGQSGEVWSAYDRYLDIVVALKLLRDPTDATGVILEASRLKALEGDRILRVSDVGIEHDIAYLATELAAGGSAEDRLREDGYRGIRPDLVVTWARQALVGLRVCHEHGFIHRDVKPGNIFLAGSEWAAIGDFGAAAVMDENGRVPHGGDPLVRAPEMIKGALGDVRSDIYSMGVTLYRLLTGTWPAEHPEWQIFRAAVTSGDHVDVRDAAPHVPDMLARCVRRALQVRAADRYQTPAELNEDLGRLRLDSAWEPQEPHPGHARCWIQSVRKNSTSHSVCLSGQESDFMIDARRRTGAGTRVTTLCSTDGRAARVPTRLRHVFMTLDKVAKP